MPHGRRRVALMVVAAVASWLAVATVSVAGECTQQLRDASDASPAGRECKAASGFSFATAEIEKMAFCRHCIQVYIFLRQQEALDCFAESAASSLLLDLSGPAVRCLGDAARSPIVPDPSPTPSPPAPPPTRPPVPTSTKPSTPAPRPTTTDAPSTTRPRSPHPSNPPSPDHSSASSSSSSSSSNPTSNSRRPSPETTSRQPAATENPQHRHPNADSYAGSSPDDSATTSPSSRLHGDATDNRHTREPGSKEVGDSGSKATVHAPAMSLKSGAKPAPGSIIGIVGGVISIVVLIVALVHLRRQPSRAHRSGSNSPPTLVSDDMSSDSQDHLERQETTHPQRRPPAKQSINFHNRQVNAMRKTRERQSTPFWEDEHISAVRIPFEKVRTKHLISRGGYGEVYFGSYRGNPVAIKSLLPERRTDMRQIEKFLAEVKLMATMEHERIVSFIGVAWDALSEVCVVTEYMARGDLRTLLDEYVAEGPMRRPLGLADPVKIQIALYIAHALAYMHSLETPVLHRDLKSRNVLLDEELNAKVTDFGISRECSPRTMTMGVGSSLWMAPEVLMGGRYDEKADIFSFGVVLSELDRHVLPYAHALESGGSGRKLPDTVILQLVSMGQITAEFTDLSGSTSTSAVASTTASAVASRFSSRSRLAVSDRQRVASSIAGLGRRCLSMNPSDRPSTVEVLHRLHNLDVM